MPIKNTLLVFREKEFSERMDAFFMAQLRNATRAWLRAVLDKIPRYTDTARGIFKPLATKLRVKHPEGGGIQLGDAERAKKKKVFKYQGREWRLGFGMGGAYGNYYFGKIDNGEYLFQFDIDLPYIIWNNYGYNTITLPSIPPWYALEAGEKAFETYVKEEVFKKSALPKIKKFLVIKENTYG